MAHQPAEHPSSDSLASAEAHAAAGEVHEHPNWSTYKWVALILTLLFRPTGLFVPTPK